MRGLLAMVAGWYLFLAPVWAQTQAADAARTVQTAQPGNASGPLCRGKNAQECGVSRQDFKKARGAFERALKLKESQPERALDAFAEAARLVPRHPEYAAAHELMRQQLVYEYIHEANRLGFQGRTVESAADLRKALQLDPGNAFAAQRLREVANVYSPPQTNFFDPTPEEQEMHLRARPGPQTLRLTADTRGAYSRLGAAFGVKISFDDSTPSRSVRLNFDQVTFEQAMNAVALVTRTYWSPVSSTEVLVAVDTPAKHKELDRWWVRTFYIPQASTPQELTDILNLLRTLFEIRFVTSAPAGGTITVRGPAPVIQAATQFLQTLWVDRPQIMLDFEVYEITGQMLRDMGVSLPLQLNLFNIPESVVSLLNNGQLTQLAGQLNSSGSLGQLNGSNLSALITQLGLSTSQQNELTALLQNPVATFGGGLTMFGVSIPPGTVSFSKSDSRVISLDKISMRAAQGNAATFRLGSRYPILNASYSAFSPLLSGTTSLANFPSFTYEDLGISIKAKPTIRDTDVVLDLEMEVKSLGAESVNSIPIINNRSFKGVIAVKNNEPAVVAGALTRTDQKSLSGIPGISQLPGLGLATSSRNDEVDEDEFLVMITPHILTGPPADTRAIVVPTGY